MEDWQEWGYLEEETLTRKRRKICITCNHFRYSTTSSCVTILTCPFHQKLIPQGDHLIKGCRYWRENSGIFAPEAAWNPQNKIHRFYHKDSYKLLMKSLLASNRSKAILGIGILAIGIGAISKKVISYPSGGCMKGAQEMTFNLNKSILNKPWISWDLKILLSMPYQTLAANSYYYYNYSYSTGKTPTSFLT